MLLDIDFESTQTQLREYFSRVCTWCMWSLACVPRKYEYSLFRFCSNFIQLANYKCKFMHDPQGWKILLAIWIKAESRRMHCKIGDICLSWFTTVQNLSVGSGKQPLPRKVRTWLVTLFVMWVSWHIHIQNLKIFDKFCLFDTLPKLPKVAETAKNVWILDNTLLTWLQTHVQIVLHMLIS